MKQTQRVHLTQAFKILYVLFLPQQGKTVSRVKMENLLKTICVPYSSFTQIQERIKHLFFMPVYRY